jgi:S-(hydroxymethyl)glutathione dehydrogenase/alcohol dehydrogenase
MGCSTFSNFTVLPEIALAKVREDAPFDKICYIGCGVTTGIGAVIYTAKVWPGANVVVFGLGGIGLNVIQGARMVGADKIIGVDINPAKVEMAKKFGMTDFVNPGSRQRQGRAGDRRPDRRRRGFLLRVHRQHHHAPGAGMLPSRLGREHHHRRGAEAGKEIATRPFQLVTGRVWKGTAFGGARGRTDVPKIVDWYMEGKINIDDLITHTMPLDEINTAFDLMHEGKSIRSVVVF